MEGGKKATCKNEDSLYLFLDEVLHKDLSFDTAYQLKQYILKPELIKTTKVSREVIVYIYNNLKDWYNIVTNPNACRIFLLVLSKNDKLNSMNISQRLKLGSWHTVERWTKKLENLFIFKKSEYVERKEYRWRVCLEDPLISGVVPLTAYFCDYMLKEMAVLEAKRVVRDKYSLGNDKADTKLKVEKKDENEGED